MNKMIRVNGIWWIWEILTIMVLPVLTCITAHGQEYGSLQLEIAVPDTTITMGRKVEYRREKARNDIENAKDSKKNGELADALRYYLSALYELETLQDSIGIMKTKTEIGDIFYENNLYEKALEYYSGAERILSEKNHDLSYLLLIERIADVEYQSGQYKSSIDKALELHQLSDELEKDTLEIEAYHLLIRSYAALKEWEKAKPLAKKVIRYYRLKGEIRNLITGLNNLGYIHKNLNNNDSAIALYDQVAQLEKETDGAVHPSTLVNLAIVYQNLGDEAMAVNYLNQAARLAENTSEMHDLAPYLHLTALVYFSMNDYYNAGLYNKRSQIHAKTSNDLQTLRAALLLSSEIKEALYDFEGAMEDYGNYLSLKDSLAFEERIKQQELVQLEFQIERLSRESENLWASGELSYLELQRLKLDSANRQKELEILHQTDSIQKITIQNQRLENLRIQQELLLKEEQIYAAKKKKEVDSLQQVGRIQTLELEQQKLVQKEQEARIAILDKENQLNELNLKKVRARNRFLVGFVLLALVIIYLVYRGLRYAKRTNKILSKQKNEIERQKDEIDCERRRSDKLLLNILPEETAEELKEKGAATPRQYEMVSVLFTDFKGFTNIAEKLTPAELVEELNQCFMAFDHIIDKHNLEKIKTIGDAYMCAGGIPIANKTNPTDIIKAGLEIRDFMDTMKLEREKQGKKYWELRIGIHTGSVVAGVVGKNKFAYDIWGDAVNTASRMESSGIPGKVNISGTTYELVKNNFNCTYRGKIEAKNKGEIDMYIVEESKP
ncbi:MAG: tetratricopeptide repeat protein [Bacteroidetes bacterium]|nr:tetratricopeptide repeat protein [Bacteroidota bacterium]